jgi:hypothetical protein
MPRRLTRDTRTSLARALGHACRLTRRYVSGEHLMTMLVCAVSAVHPGPGRPARAVLHKYGATMEDVAEEIARRAGPGAVLFGGLDRDALAAIGIDLDAARQDRVVFRAGSPYTGRPPGASPVRAERRPEHASAAPARSPGHLRGCATGSDQQGEGAEIMNAPTTCSYEHPSASGKAVVAPPD